jgi:RHS repeat-associated protein
LTDLSNGAVVATYTYSAFGICTASGSGAAICNFRFGGMYWQANAGCYYDKARDYQAPTGKFMQRDPSGEDGGDNLEAYCAANPINRIDPSGLQSAGIGGPDHSFDGIKWSVVWDTLPDWPSHWQGVKNATQPLANIPSNFANFMLTEVRDFFSGDDLGEEPPIQWVPTTDYATRSARERGDSPTIAAFSQGVGGNALSFLIPIGVTKACSAFTAGDSISSVLFREAEGGGSWLQTKRQFDDYARGMNIIGRADGRFMTSSVRMNQLIAQTGGGPVKLGKLLGVDWGPGTTLIRMDVSDPLLLNPPMPTSSMSGANSMFRLGGFTSGGVSEFVTDQLPGYQVWSSPVMPGLVVPPPPDVSTVLSIKLPPLTSAANPTIERMP